MSSDDDRRAGGGEKLRLNTLHRYAKHSDRLVLMEYTHCEVPAGCGGYVMRWHDPRAGLPLVFDLACPWEAEAFIDGAPVAASRVTLSPGDHLFALHIAVQERPAPLVVAVFLDDPETSDANREAILLSADDGSWRCTTRAPFDASWIEAGYVDMGWPALRAWEPTDAELGERRWRYQELLDRGAAALRLESREVWIRKRISIPERSATR